MLDQPKAAAGSGSAPGAFNTTLWTVVLEAGRADSPQSHAALERLCQVYWYPLYAYVRRRGHDEHSAQDLTQEFFHSLIEKNYIQAADRNRGRFRTFLLTSLNHFLTNEWKRSQRQKRGGGAVHFSLDAATAEERFRMEPAGPQTPETLYEQRWAQALVEQVMARLREEFTEAGKSDRFDALKTLLLDDDAQSQAEIGKQLGISESAVKSAVHRMRARYGELFREEIANTVAGPAEVDAEIRELFAVLGQG
jgi:RNA polymerase sigma factor (sigma-70 family)